MSEEEGYDPYTLNQLPVVPPGFTNSIRIGNCTYSGQAEALYYDLYVTPQSTLLYLYFAIVIQAPGHGTARDPAFIIRVTADTAFNMPVSHFSVWFPNAFTPRLETNNTFHAHTRNILVDYEIYIYDRRGALVFHSVDPHEGWNGFCKGKPCPQDSYVYIATFRKNDGSSRLLSMNGTVTLIR